MNDDVRVWALLIFSLCCCLLKDMITRLFRSSYCLRSKFTRAALVWRCVSYLRDRRAQYGSVQQGSAKSGLCTAITQVNYTRQPSEKSWSTTRRRENLGYRQENFQRAETVLQSKVWRMDIGMIPFLFLRLYRKLIGG